MKHFLILFTILSLSILYSCTEINTEVVGDDYYEGDQIAIVGYLSNFGAVANIQKTQSPLNKNNDSRVIGEAKVELLNAANDAVVTVLEKQDEYNYTTPLNFIPEKDQSYYIKVSAPGLSTVFSTPQKLIDRSPGIDSVTMKIEETYFQVEDPTVYTIFGKPRSIWFSYFINNGDSAITNNFSKLLYRYKSDLYDYSGGNYVMHTKPHFFFNLGTGTNHFIDIPAIVSSGFVFNDQIKTSETVEYKGTTYQVIERIESVIIQSVLFSSDFINYFEKVNEYLENRTDPFSIMAEKIPSNLSNRIGFFGSLAITEKEIVLPTIKNGSVVIDF